MSSGDASESQIEFSLAAVANMFDLVQQDLFSSRYINDLRKSLNPVINASVGRYGIDVTDMECRVLEVILKGFTETDYDGNYRSISRQELSTRIDSEIDFDSTCREKFPRLRFTQADLMKELGVSRNQPGAISRAVSALDSLSTKMFTFFFERKAFDREGNYLKDEKGEYVYESVMAQGTLLTLLRIQEKGVHRLKNYEVVLNPIFLDEREEHCLIVPSNWRNEVASLVGKRKTSPMVFKFLIFLRYAHEFFARENQRFPHTLEVTMEEMAGILKIAPSVIKNKKRTRNLLETCYSTAQSLGYLEDFSIGEYMHKLVLNEKKYFHSGRQEEKKLLN